MSALCIGRDCLWQVEPKCTINVAVEVKQDPLLACIQKVSFRVILNSTYPSQSDACLVLVVALLWLLPLIGERYT